MKLTYKKKLQKINLNITKKLQKYKQEYNAKYIPLNISNVEGTLENNAYILFKSSSLSSLIKQTQPLPSISTRNFACAVINSASVRCFSLGSVPVEKL